MAARDDGGISVKTCLLIASLLLTIPGVLAADQATPARPAFAGSCL
jgi:hypothetical protein